MFWFPGLYYPQSFLTALLQNYSRRHNIKIEDLEFHNEVLSNNETINEGCVLDGLILEAARWEGKLEENVYKEFCVKMPKIHFLPAEISTPDLSCYKCPVYKTVLRVGAQGQESNFITHVYLKTDVEPSHWIKRGVALLCEYDFV